MQMQQPAAAPPPKAHSRPHVAVHTEGTDGKTSGWSSSELNGPSFRAPGGLSCLIMATPMS
eukprot:CAMPEP_0174734516 /NCGR_PEP_ID=MMETSP1094-20130205/63499_1 /TAXON_ID=156173 /ORGANISM="Chrysochromulina brevifilum, Strain UTEX LB 985" /LENGTH=60 /DNA_ID=CAMNT_0015937347 /DNA_START=21 /DNA_END=203 /DNA_ORIENTATION=-